MLFGEYIPFYDAIPWFTKLFPEASNFSRGSEPATFPLQVGGRDYRLGPLICYEDILPGFARRVARLDPNAFINITNDAWFGRTAEPYQHLALAVFRSVEHRIEMIRAVNTGVSAHIDAAGRVRAQTESVDPDELPPPTPKTLLVDLAMLAGRRALPPRRRPVRARLPGRAGRHPGPVAAPHGLIREEIGAACQFDEAQIFPPPTWWVIEPGARDARVESTARHAGRLEVGHRRHPRGGGGRVPRRQRLRRVRASRTHDLTAEIATNESPSILYLAAARAELRDLQRLLNTHVLLASTGQPAPTQPLKDVRDRLRENLQHYFALPALPNEKELWQRIDKELTDVDVLAGQIMEATGAGRYATAQKLLVDELPDAIDDEADAIMADIQLNAARVREVAGDDRGRAPQPDAVGVRARRRQRGAGDLAGGAGAQDAVAAGGDRPAPVGGAGRFRGTGRARSAEPDLGGRDVAGGDRARRRGQRADDDAGGARAGAASAGRAA